MIKILSGHSLTATDAFRAERMQLQLSERQSTATLTISDSVPALSVGDWLQSESGPGAGIVWRVKTIESEPHKGTRNVTLEHAISTLRDRLMFGKVTTQMISGGSTATAQQAVEYILNKQSDWTLGTIDYSSSAPYHFSGEDLFSALETVSSSLEDCLWTYDFSSYPFTINITQMDSTVGSEMRSDRNIQTLKKNIDRSRMYTRIYPTGKNNLKLDSEYLSKNEDLYGVISKTESDESITTKSELQAWAQARLNRHCEPVVTVTISGLDLSRATGESLDSFTIGKICRVPLPEFSTTITERVTKLSYGDTVNTPEVVTVTLANELQDVAKILKEQSAGGARSARNKADNEEEDHAWIVDTKDKVALVAEAVAGKDGDEPNWSRVAQLTVDGNGIDARVTHAEGEIVDAFAAIVMTESSIRSDVVASQSQIYSYIIQTASSINVRVASKKRTWIQDTDPRSGGITPDEGDIWVESTHQGTWDGAEGFDWDHDADYDWSQIQGAKIWGWANDKWELVSDQQQVVTITDVEQTSEHIVNRALKALVNDDGNLSVYRAELLIEGDRIRSEVHEATSALYSFILQTASQITIRVGESNMVFHGMEQPTGTSDHPLVDGDIWLETSMQRIWSDMEELDSWVDDEDFDWSDLKGSKVHVYDGESESFKEVLDEQVLAQDTDIEQTSEKIDLVARSVKQVDGKVDVFRAELKVTANEIRSSVNQRIEGIGSTITQTASEIRSEVHAAQSTIYSSISQTASQIRLEVANTISGVNSMITQNANRISLVVDSNGIKPAAIVTAINNGASSVLLSADHVLIDGSTTLHGAMQISNGNLNVTNHTVLGGGATLGSSKSLEVLSSSSIKFGQSTPGSSSLTLSGGTLATTIKQAVVESNTLTLTQYDGTTITFSKATSLSGAWSGKTFTVTATQNGTSVGTLSANPDVHPVSSQGAAYTDIYVATYDGSNWTNHGNAVRLTMSNAGGRVDLKDANGNVYAQLSVPSSRTDKGSNWYCTVTQNSSGKTCTLTKTFGLSQTVPFSNGSSYHLYT